MTFNIKMLFVTRFNEAYENVSHYLLILRFSENVAILF